MAREISYDVQAVKARALDAFFAKGFAETSLVDLESATGLNRRQLYNGFGDKRALFLSVLDDFADQAPRVFLADLIREGAGLSEIATTLRYLSDNSDTDRGRLGCLICNTAREAIVSDESVGSRVRQFFRRIEGTYRGAVDNAIAAARLAPSGTRNASLDFYSVSTSASAYSLALANPAM